MDIEMRSITTRQRLVNTDFIQDAGRIVNSAIGNVIASVTERKMKKNQLETIRDLCICGEYDSTHVLVKGD